MNLALVIKGKVKMFYCGFGTLGDYWSKEKLFQFESG